MGARRDKNKTEKKEIKTKRCSKCKQYQPLTNFFKRPNGQCGRRSRCKTCEGKEYAEFVQNNSEYMQEANKDRYARKRYGVSVLARKHERKAKPRKILYAKNTSHLSELNELSRKAFEFMRNYQLSNQQEATYKQTAQFLNIKASRVESIIEILRKRGYIISEETYKSITNAFACPKCGYILGAKNEAF